MPYAESQYIIDEVLNNSLSTDETGIPPGDLTASITPGNGTLNLYFELKDTIVGGGGGTL